MEIDYVVVKDLDSGANSDIIAILNDVLAHNVTKETWDWEFNSNKGAVFTIAKDEDNIAGTQSMLSIGLCVGNKRMPSAKSETSYLFSDYRGRKIFEKLYQVAVDTTVQNGSGLVWGFTPAVKAWKNNLGFEVKEGIVSKAVVTTHNWSYKDVASKSSNPILAFIRYVRSRGRHTKFLQSINALALDVNIDVVDNVKKISDFEGLFNNLKVRNERMTHIEMNETYYHWRVLNNPVLDYQKMFFYKEDKLVGYIIYTVKDRQITIADITYNLNHTVLESMFRHLMKTNNSIHYVNYWGNPDNAINKGIFNLMEGLESRIYVDKGMNFVYQLYNPELNRPDFSDMSNWYINGLWTEGFHV